MFMSKSLVDRCMKIFVVLLEMLHITFVSSLSIFI